MYVLAVCAYDAVVGPSSTVYPSRSSSVALTCPTARLCASPAGAAEALVSDSLGVANAGSEMDAVINTTNVMAAAPAPRRPLVRARVACTWGAGWGWGLRACRRECGKG
ncbi:exported hypothetical protein [Plantibacter sp. T3]|nr:exported hypothetical protein [Plantibacter sp. T3]